MGWQLLTSCRWSWHWHHTWMQKWHLEIAIKSLYIHWHTIINWPAGVTAIGPKFSTKSLIADELHALAIPFLKDQMGDDYAAEPGDPDKDVTSLIQMPKALFFLREWTQGRLDWHWKIIHFTNIIIQCTAILLMHWNWRCSMFHLYWVCSLAPCICSLTQKASWVHFLRVCNNPKGAKSPASSLPPFSPPPKPSPEQPVWRHAPAGCWVNFNPHCAVIACHCSISPASSVGEGPSQPCAQGHVQSASQSLPVACHSHQPVPASPHTWHGHRRNPYNHSPSLHSHHKTCHQAKKHCRED